VKYKAYPKYKNSGLEWLGEVPAHWEIKRLKDVASVNDEVLPESTPPDWELVYVDIGSVDRVEGITNKEPMIFENAPSRARRLVSHGDTIVSTVRTYLKAIAPVQTPEPNMVVSTGFAVIRPRKIDPDYLSFLLRSDYFIENVVSRSVGVSYPATNATEVVKIPIVQPRSDEQLNIAIFLSQETKKIDGLVSKKRALIEKLKEKRTALISRTVTRGLPPEAARAASLDPHPKIKASGVEWLGDVPEHWGLKPMKYGASVITGYAFSSDDFVDDGIPLVRIGDIKKDGSVDLSNAKNLPKEFAQTYNKVLIHAGDIVMAMTGATIGKAGRYQSDQPALLNQRVCIFRANRSSDSGFLWYLLNSIFYIEHVLLTAFGGAQPNISDKELLDCIVTVPPFLEQGAISTYLEIETEKIDQLVEKTESAIERLQEYRTALITAAVTGKIDVREMQA